MKYYLSICLFLWWQISLAQEYSKEFGVISDEERALTQYKNDESAEAVVLYDIGESIFFDTEDGYEIRFTHSKRIKILDRTGSKYAEVSIPFYTEGNDRTEKVYGIEAYTYLEENGKWTKKALDQKSIYEEKLSEKWRVKKFVFPEVKEGAIIEYRYVLETPFHFNLPDWTFQDRIPTVYSQYTVHLLPFYEYVFIAQGIQKFDFKKSYPKKEKRVLGNIINSLGRNVGSGIEFQEMIHTYIMLEVPAFKDESYITSSNDYLQRMDFQLSKLNSPYGGTKEIITTWEKLNERLLKEEKFGKYIKKSKKYAQKIIDSELNLKGKNQEEKSKEIIDYVRGNFSWNGFYGKYASKSPKELVTQKSGSAADINLFLIALLEGADIDVKPVIISTRDHGKIQIDYPFDHFFNYVIALVNTGDNTFLTEGTEPLLEYNRMPLRCINEKGLIVGTKEVKWQPLTNNVKSINKRTIQLEINPEKLITQGVVDIQTTEYEAYAYKNYFKNESQKLIDELLAEDSPTKIVSLETANFEKRDQAYTMSLKTETKIEQIEDKLLISPFLNLPLQTNELRQKTRNYPVDFIYSRVNKFNANVEIPEGYKVLSLPKPYELEDKMIKIEIGIKENENDVEVMGEYSFKKAVYSPSEYAQLRRYFNMIVSKMNQQIVLEKE